MALAVARKPAAVAARVTALREVASRVGARLWGCALSLWLVRAAQCALAERDPQGGLRWAWWVRRVRWYPLCGPVHASANLLLGVGGWGVGSRPSLSRPSCPSGVALLSHRTLVLCLLRSLAMGSHWLSSWGVHSIGGSFLPFTYFDATYVLMMVMIAVLCCFVVFSWDRVTLRVARVAARRPLSLRVDMPGAVGGAAGVALGARVAGPRFVSMGALAGLGLRVSWAAVVGALGGGGGGEGLVCGAMV